MAKLLKYLLQKNEDRSLASQSPFKYLLGMASLSIIPVLGRQRQELESKINRPD